MARRRTPAGPKLVPAEDDPRSYRSRATLPGPWGDEEEPYVATLPKVLERHAADTEGGMAPVVEYKLPGTTWMPWHPILRVADLPREQAVSMTRTVYHRVTGEPRDETRWEIAPQGHRRLLEAMDHAD